MKINPIAVVLLSALLSACGGGSSGGSSGDNGGASSSSGDNTSGNNSGSGGNSGGESGSGSGSGENSSGGSSGGTTTAPGLEPVVGIYNTSRENDEAYLYIDRTGEVDVYDYLGDSSGSGRNCYDDTDAPQATNGVFDDGQVTYDAASDRFTLSSEDGDYILEFSYTPDTGMHDLSLTNNRDGSVFSGGKSINIRTGSLNVLVGGNAALQTNDIMISDIEAAECDD